MPNTVLKNLLLSGLETPPNADPAIQQAADFMADRLETLGQPDLASRLSINCAPSFVRPGLVQDYPVTVIDVFDESALSDEVKEDMYKCYPLARLGHLKTGGNFPFLSRSEEVNLHIMVSFLLYLSSSSTTR